MNRRRYKLPFRKAVTPQWECPTCGKGVLKLVKDTFLESETFRSKRAQGRDDWSPFYVEYVYSCQLKCSSSVCHDTVASIGTGFVDIDFGQDYDGNMIQDFTDYFRPKFFQPHLKLFALPKDTPEDVKSEIEESFQLFFCNPPSASNHIRIALENILTYLKIKKFSTNKGGQRVFLNLHNRIDLLPKKYAHIKDAFLAIKWLGNAGSHSSKKVTLDDVMDAYEIMEMLLEELFTNNKNHIKNMVKRINKKKGPKGK